MDVELQYRVSTLLARYADCLDQGRFEEWPDFFTADCLYRVVTADNHDLGLPLAVILCDSRDMLRDRITALREANVYEEHRYRHILSIPLINARDAGTVFAETSYQVIRIMRDGSTMLFSTGRYIDRIVEDGDDLLFAERTVVCDSRRVDILLVIPL